MRASPTVYGLGVACTYDEIRNAQMALVHDGVGSTKGTGSSHAPRPVMKEESLCLAIIEKHRPPRDTI